MTKEWPPEHYPTRYVVTRIGRDGMRTLTHAAQGRETYATPEEAQDWIDAARKVNAPSSIAFLNPDTWEVRPVKCYPGHFDPCGVYFD